MPEQWRIPGAAIFSAVGFAGLRPFETARSALAEADGPPAPAAPEVAKGEDITQDDPGRAPLARAIASGRDITLRVARPGHVPAWRGRVELVQPLKGSLDILIPSLHLHPRAGAVAASETREAQGAEVRSARDAEGRDIGLRVTFQAA